MYIFFRILSIFLLCSTRIRLTCSENPGYYINYIYQICYLLNDNIYEKRITDDEDDIIYNNKNENNICIQLGYNYKISPRIYTRNNFRGRED